MPLNFPNPSRSYDESRRSIRFSGYDGAFEIPFSIDVDALPMKHGNSHRPGEDDYLSAFDYSRKSIQDVACEAYSHGRKEIYLLKASDFR